MYIIFRAWKMHFVIRYKFSSSYKTLMALS
jgi:hypothetical protein